MKRKTPLTRIVRFAALSGLICFACIVAVRAQQYTVFPRVCAEFNAQKGSVRLAADAAAGNSSITVDGAVPVSSVLTINRGGNNEEGGTFYVSGVTGSNPFTLSLKRATGAFYNLVNAHSTNETVEFDQAEIEAHFGYNNISNAVRTIPRSVTTFNYFTPGNAFPPGQPNQFQPGSHENVFTVRLPSQLLPEINWLLDGNSVAVNSSTAGCATITYQGRLTEAGAAANGNYDIRLTLFDAATGGAAQSEPVVIEDTPAVNGIFTVYPNFYSALTNNNRAKFLEIAVRPGAASGTDSFTVLAPRQPITTVPYAVNAANAFNVQLPIVNAAPLAGDCNNSTRGQMRVDSANSKLYICIESGWKSTTLQ